MTFTRLANLTLNFFWALSGMGLLILIVWFSAPGVIEKIDKHFRQIYLYEPPDRFADIINRYDTTADHALVVEELVTLLSELEEIQKIDELTAIKRFSYSQLVRVFLRVGQFEQAMYWTKQWLEFDPKDVEAILAHARLLMINPDTLPEGEYRLALLKAQFPNSLAVANGAAIAYGSLGQLGRAFLEFAPFIEGSHPLKRRIGETLRTVDYSHQAGDPPKELNEKFDSGESLELHITRNPSTVVTDFNNTGLDATDYGFRKQIGTFGMLHLFRFEQDKDFTIRVDVKVATPEALEKLMQPQFKPLLVSQLVELGKPEAIETYETFAATL